MLTSHQVGETHLKEEEFPLNAYFISNAYNREEQGLTLGQPSGETQRNIGMKKDQKKLKNINKDLENIEKQREQRRNREKQEEEKKQKMRFRKQRRHLRKPSV